MTSGTKALIPLSEIFDRLGESILFRRLPAAIRRSLGRRVRPRAVRSGEIIIREGEVGEALYLLVEGSVRVTVTRPQGEDTDHPETGTGTGWPVPVARLTPGDHFGEQALLHEEPAPRTATVQAIEDCRLLEIPAAALRRAIEFDEQLQQVLVSEGRAYVLNRMRKQTRALQSVESQLANGDYERRNLVDREVIFRQGQSASCAYLLTSGTVEVTFYDEQRRLRSVVELVAPRLFGELGILQSAPRSGTVVAVGDVETVVVPAEELLELHRSSPQLRELCRSLENVYDIPGVGHATHYRGTFMEMPAYCVVLRRDDGTEFIAYKTVESEVFAVTQTRLDEPEVEVVRHEADVRTRELSIADGRLVGITSYGHWSDSERITAAVMNRLAVGEADIEAFKRDGALPSVLGRLPAPDPAVLCRCMGVTGATVLALMDSGVCEVEALMRRCGAGTVCGGCRPQLEQMLGHRAWAPCRLDAAVEHTPQIWSFRLVPVTGSTQPFEPGQHVVVRAKIEGRWIARSYTLTSTAKDSHYEVTVKREYGGLFSDWMYTHAAKQPTLHVSAPQGNFVIGGRGGRSIVLFAAGIGVTPALSFLRGCIDGSVAVEPDVPILLDYSTRTFADAVGRDVIGAAVARLPQFRCRHRLTSVDGRLNRDGVVGLLREYDDPRVYICGPASYEANLVAILRECGVPPEAITVEEFTPVAAVARQEAVP